MPTLTLSRVVTASRFDISPWHVLVDGERVGKVPMGADYSTYLGQGTHSLQVRGTSGSSPKVHFSVVQDVDVRFECRPYQITVSELKGWFRNLFRGGYPAIELLQVDR